MSIFEIVILIGYASGILHKYLYKLDSVIWLYGLNAAMVSADMALWIRNRRLERKAA